MSVAITCHETKGAYESSLIRLPERITHTGSAESIITTNLILSKVFVNVYTLSCLSSSESISENFTKKFQLTKSGNFFMDEFSYSCQCWSLHCQVSPF